MSFQADSLERDALEVLRLVRSIKNSFAPINRIPPEVLSLIPGYYDEDDTDQASITLTHVCHSWRDTFTSCSSLWTRLDLTNVDKTHAYIQRSRSAPFKLCLVGGRVIDDAFAMMIPHTHRFKSLTIDAKALPSILRYRMPLLEKLDIYIYPANGTVLDDTLFGGDLSSLYHLRLHGITTDFPWKNLPNLRTVDLRSLQHRYGTTQLLDFFESAPLLHTVRLVYWKPDLSDPPPERIVPLRHLKEFFIQTDSSHSILLQHIHLPFGASLVSESRFSGETPVPVLDYLPAGSPNLSNLSHITMANFLFDSRSKYVRLSGPSGRLRLLFSRDDWVIPSSCSWECEILRSLGPPTFSTVRRLTVSTCERLGTPEDEECPIFLTLSSARDLQTLVLVRCDNLPFILALDPEQTQSNLVLCPNLQNLIFYVQSLSPRVVERLARMAKNRASRGTKLSSVTIVELSGRGRSNELFELREHVTHVGYYTYGEPPAWDDVPDESCGGGRIVSR